MPGMWRCFRGDKGMHGLPWYAADYDDSNWTNNGCLLPAGQQTD